MATPEQVAALRAFVGAASHHEDEFLAQCWDRASALVAKHIEGSTVPAAEIAGATEEVAAELFHRQAAPNGISQFSDGNGNPVRVARDPMVAAYKTLAPYVGFGIG